ncbi:helix-turn-helix transcriptional regulator [Microbacterium sp. NPDC058345]|uniref:helix-turn-helix transcriptional regulator n=1 Tax=Microbacterium sp. NPDC058345 TaxID=3346455 RepID=UPI00365566F8
MDISHSAASIGTLADDTRRALYEYVVAQQDAVGREAAAEAVNVPGHMARFHLDKLVEAGLLDTEFRRLSGRSGPGAGRPSKLYRRVDRTVALSLPERRYDLVGHLLALAIERAAQGVDLDTALHEVAHAEGLRTAASAPSAEEDELARAADVLDAHGFEPRATDAAILLANCPFDSLAREHTAVVCAANHAFVGGLLDGLGCEHLRAHAEPHEDRCCVTVRQAG